MKNREARSELHSIGHAAVVLARLPREILKALATIGDAPALSLDGVPHLDAEQLERLRVHFENVPSVPRSDNAHLRRRRIPHD